MADLDGFFFNVEKFFGSMSVQRMSFAEKGVYLVMMFQQWRAADRNLPDDPKAIADLIAITPAQVAEIDAAWEVVRRKFVTSDHTPKRIWNVAVERTRRAQRANARKRREAGRAAGKASAAKRLAARELPVNDRSTTVQRSSTDKRDKKDQIREIRKNVPEEPGNSLEVVLAKIHDDERRSRRAFR